MSTGAARTSPPAPPVASAATAAPQAFIDEQLTRTRQHIRWMDVASGCVAWLTALVAFLLVAAVIDHWVAPLSTIGRWLALVAMLGMTVAAFWRLIIPPLVRKVNPAFAAQVIEQRGERLHNSLLNYLFLRTSRTGVPEVVYQSLERRAAGDLQRVPWEQVMDHSRAFRWAYVLAGVLAACAAYKILSPKDPLQTVARVFSPWAELARPSRVELRDVQPGDTRIFHGRLLTVSAEIRGLRAAEAPRVVYSTADGQTVNDTVTMNLSPDGLRFEATVPPGRDGVRQNLTYRVEAGDAVSREFHVELLPAPTIVVERVEYDPPRYTGLARSVVEHQGDLRGLEGTKVTIQARASLPIKSAFIEFDPLAKSDARNPQDASRILHMVVDGTQARQSFVLQCKPDRSGALHESYHVRFVTADDARSEAPILHAIAVQPDLPPEVEFLAPRQAEIMLRADQSLPIELRAIDPDFGITRLTLRAEREGTSLLNEPLLDDAKGVPGQIVGKYDFSPRKLQLQAGAEVAVWAEVADNRVDWKSGRLAPNTQRTSIIKVRIVASEPTAQANESADPAHPESTPKPGDSNSQDPTAPMSPSGKQPESPNSSGAKPSQKPEPKSSSQSPPSSKDKSASKDKATGDKPQQGDSQTGEPKPADKPGSKSGTQPGDKPDSKPGDQPGAKPSDKPGDSPRENSGDQPSPKEKSPKDKSSQKSPESSAGGESRPPKPGQTQEGDPKQAGESPSGKSDKQDAGKGQSGTGSSQSSKPNDPPSGADPSNSGTGTPSESTSPSGAAGSPDASTPSPNGSGQPSGKNQGATQSQGANQGQGTGQGQPTGELHDGDVFQRALEHIQSRQGERGKPAGKPGDPPSGKPEGPPNRTKPEGTSGQSDSQPTNDSQSPGDPAAGKPTPGKPASGQTDSSGQPGAKPSSSGNSPDTSGKPQGGTETKPESAPRPGDQPKGPSPGAGTGQNGESGAGERPEKPSGGSPSPLTPPSDRPKSQSPDNKQSAGGDETPTPSESKKQSDSKGGAGGDRAGGGKQGGGQGAKQSGNDSAGGSSPGDEGNGAASERGQGPDGTTGGSGKPTEKPTGKPGGDQRGAGTTGAPGDGSQSTPQGTPPSKPDAGQSSTGSAARDPAQPSSAGNASGSSPRVPTTGGGKPGDSTRGSPTQAGEVPEGDDANLDYARRSTDLVLNYLRDQQDNPDPELLNKLGWTPEELRKFLDRWQQLKQAADRRDPQARHELDESLKSLGLRSNRTQPRAASASSDTVRGNRDEGQRSSPPARYLEQFKAYRKGTSRTEVQGK